MSRTVMYTVNVVISGKQYKIETQLDIGPHSSFTCNVNILTDENKCVVCNI